MRIAVISDEISDDLDEAVQLGSLLGIKTFELRWVRMPGTFRRRRVGELSDEEAIALATTARQHGVTISAISPGLLYSHWGDAAAVDEQMARLERSFHLAGLLGARDVTIQSFLPPEGQGNSVCPAAVIDILAQAAERAQAAGFRLRLKNTPDCYADTGAHTASIVHAVRSPALGVSWDPCHAARAGENAICDGYPWIAPFVQDVRVKDQEQRADLGFEYTILAQGGMDWPAQLRALARDGYQGTVTLGAQLEPRLFSTLHSLQALERLLASV